MPALAIAIVVVHETIQSAIRCLRELAGLRPRNGYRRLVILLKRKGWYVNAKVMYKLYRKENL